MTQTVTLEQIPESCHRILVGFSGGADSTALLCLLLDAQPRTGFRVFAVHVNHGLRGDESDADEAFVRAFCTQHEVPLQVFRLSLSPGTGENEAREARYACFREAAQQTGADAIALAHHRDDQAETLLLHLMRGSGLDGLGGMRAVSVTDWGMILRPLLSASRESLVKYLQNIGQSWREDSSNHGMRYLRNQVRHELLPDMERMIPGVSERLAHTAESIQEELRFLDMAAQAYLPSGNWPLFLSQTVCNSIPEALLSRVLRTWWKQAAGFRYSEHALSMEQTKRFSGLVRSAPGSICNLPEDWRAYRGWQGIHLLPPYPCPVPEKPVLVPSTDRSGNGDGKRYQRIAQNLYAKAVVRTRNAGDWIRPFGMQGRKPIREYLSEHHIDRPFRDWIPMLCCGSEVLWVCGVGAGDVSVSTDAASVMLAWQGEIPWL